MSWWTVGPATGQAPADEAAPRVPAPLFTADAPLDLRLTADFDAIAKERGETKHDHPGVLAWVGPAGDTVSLDVKLRTRGHFRLRICEYPPLRVDFPRKRAGATVFAGQNTLKLTVQCRGGERYANYVLEEYLLYRAYNLLTELSFRVRLARVTYVDARGKDDPETRFAFFLEDDDDMARRNGGLVFKQGGVYAQSTDFDQVGLLGVFQYMIGNTDWSIPGLHNIVLVQDSSRAVFPVPYDFDWSGVISTPYARPDSRLGISSVRERLFRVACRTPEDLAPAFALLRSRQDTIYGLYRAQAGLDPKRVKQALEYYDQFYRTIADARRARNAVELRCPGR